MPIPLETHTGLQKILSVLGEFDYLTANHITRLLYAPSSHAHVRKQLNALVAAKLVVPLASKLVMQPRVYTLTGKGYAQLARQGMAYSRRVRPREEKVKAHNFMFLKHTTAVADILIAARLLTKHNPDIVLNRLYLERELKRKIYVPIPVLIGDGKRERREMCLEPDTAVDFVIHGEWQEFFHIEVYRTHLREERFKQKIHTYAAYAASTIHQELFHTASLNIAVFCASSQLAERLKRWTEEVLQQGQLPQLGERFFFTSSDPATASPEVIFLSPVWEQALSTTKTPLLVLE
jgi:hypothetical protein